MNDPLQGAPALLGDELLGTLAARDLLQSEWSTGDTQERAVCELAAQDLDFFATRTREGRT